MTSYITIRTGIAAFITANIGWADEVFDYSPTDAATVFGNLPAIIVDFDRQDDIQWNEVDGNYLKAVPLLIEIYAVLEKGDSSGGRDASENIANYLNDIEDLFKTYPSIGGLVKSSTIRSTKVESLVLEAINVGILSRWAWITLLVYVLA